MGIYEIQHRFDIASAGTISPAVAARSVGRSGARAALGVETPIKRSQRTTICRMIKPTTEEVDKLILVLKQMLRSMEWTPKISRKKPTRWFFETACLLGSTETSNVIFRAEFRPATTLTRGQAVIELQDMIYVGLFIGEHRVCAMDTHPGQEHTNSVGVGRPYYKKLIDAATHIHIWTDEGEGYVEPVEPPILDCETLFTEFLDRVNLLLKGEFVHPLKGEQLEITGSWIAQD